MADSKQPEWVIYVIACQDDWAASHPEQIKRLLKSLDQAEEYHHQSSDRSKGDLTKKAELH